MADAPAALGRTCKTCGCQLVRRGGRGPWPTYCETHKGAPARAEWERHNGPAPEIPLVGAGPLLTAAGGGNRLVTLQATRDKIAQSLDEATSPPHIAQLSKQMMDVLEQIDGLAPKQDEGKGKIDELNRKRAERRKQNRSVV